MLSVAYVLSALISPLALLWVVIAICVPERREFGYQSTLLGVACAISLFVIFEFFRIRTGKEAEVNLYVVAVEFSAGFTIGVVTSYLWKKARRFLSLLHVGSTQRSETEKYNGQNMNRSVYWILSVSVLLLLLILAYRFSNKTNHMPKIGNSAFHRAGLDFRRILLNKWKARPNQLRSDFTDFCDANFAGLTLTQAQEKMEGAGQIFKFVVAEPQPIKTPKGMVALYGGLGLANTWISSASFQILIFVDAQGNPDVKKVRKIEECVIINVDL